MPPSLPTQIESVRSAFPALERQHQGQPLVYFDGPAGTQVPNVVIDAISDYLRMRNANHDGYFLTSRESDAMLAEAHRGGADFLQADDPDCVYFGANMTTLTMGLSRSLARTWKAGDEIVLTRLDHSANISPWVLAAEDAGVTVRFVEIQPDDCTLNLDQLHQYLSEKTRLVAVGCASNATGTVNPVRQIADAAHDAGALVFLDAVHYAPHRRIDVQAFGADFLACSAYKFFGPHIGMMWGRRDLLEALNPYKVRPCSNELPDRWMSGTQNHACIAGTLAAIDYLADLGRQLSEQPDLDRRAALDHSYDAIEAYENQLLQQLLDGLNDMPAIQVYGINDRQRLADRLPTVAFTHRDIPTTSLAQQLGERGICTWHGNYYAIDVTESLGLEPEGMLRVGLVHYNTADEVGRLLNTLAGLQ